MATPALGLKQFVLRSNVLSLYRDFCRACKRLPPGQREEVMAVVRDEFQRAKEDADEFAVESALGYGKIQLSRLHDMVSSARPA
mmetsp:Transcript_6297/g.15874  ORF Transcript_6297/g.15874 Transcript_6297/m.15874 type:complete len:84 (-) Transcript_6297:97-348(-)|eukprot:CAMPEP_0206257506 /NCGR_PEP_ID=MMETSP0047_2-20121206/25378_1 /ASSEMBLY_ACC=CAM_ASM_000192 /TAXON_ID=195065 /ORGANISM="Chroomonas mesostigmatica_cf, Strain CCMP1168" /LENGTH=83 /DNA_ID=CAMNT_0053684099 /DNA_START=79 /DNA_END=330 /DNA_ORIENTATION=+